MTYQAMCDRLAAASAENGELLAVEEGAEKVLTDEERTRSDTLEAEIEKLSAEIKRYEEDQVRRDRQRTREEVLTHSRRLLSTTQTQPLVETVDVPKPKHTSTIRRPRSYGRLRAFHGPDAAEQAYRAGMFCLAVTANHHGAQAWCREHGVMLSPQAEDSNQVGGFLVPPEFETAIINLREEYGVFRRESKVVPMNSDTRTVPRRKTGLTGYYVGENSAVTESNATWDQVQLVARKLGCLAKYSTELDEDAIISMADDLADEMAYAFARKEDDAGFLGDGTSAYGGISGLITECATATATTVTAATGNTAFSTLDLADFESMVGKLPQYAEGGARWYISKAGWAASMLRLIDAAGGNTGAMIAGTAPREFLGYPVVISQVMNSTLTAQASKNGIAYLGDLRLATTFGNRRGVTIKVSDQRYLEYDQIGILGTQRFAINVHDVGDTSSAGPAIMLATPAS